MKKAALIISLFLLVAGKAGLSQSVSDVSVYLLTCGPGTETYSIYGHCALRITKSDENSDLVYNWGVFDFSTPNFAWKFAKGRLDYMLGVYPFDRFIQEYFLEQRWVQCQKVNLDSTEKQILLGLLAENQKPENLKYRYDFFYDNCATRIRDLLEKSLGGKLVYPPDPGIGLPTFRDMIGKYERPYGWLKAGTDLLIGTRAEKKVSFRDKMFLPVEMQEGLSEIVINRGGKMIPLLQNPETLVDFETPGHKQPFLFSPLFIFSLIFLIITLLSAMKNRKYLIKWLDVFVFGIFSLLALMMFFFSFFTDHEQLRRNLNILWISPFIIMCLVAVIMNRDWVIWFRIVFVLCILSFFIQLIFSYAFNNAFIPLLLILILRSSARADFSWNPFSIELF